MNETVILAITVLPLWLAIAIIALGLLPTVSIVARAPQAKPNLMQKVAAGLGFLAAACIETQPAPKGDVWDSLSECPHCNAMFMTITEGKTARGLIPQTPANAAS